MKHIIITVFTLLSVGISNSQPKVYSGNSNYSGDIICNLKDGKVYKKNSNYSSEILCKVSGNKVYKNNSNYSSDVLFTVKEGKGIILKSCV